MSQKPKIKNLVGEVSGYIMKNHTKKSRAHLCQEKGQFFNKVIRLVVKKIENIY